MDDKRIQQAIYYYLRPRVHVRYTELLEYVSAQLSKATYTPRDEIDRVFQTMKLRGDVEYYDDTQSRIYLTEKGSHIYDPWYSKSKVSNIIFFGIILVALSVIGFFLNELVSRGK